MDWQNFTALKNLFDKYQIKPLIGVIPDNQDKNLKKSPARKDFWSNIRNLSKYGWTVAQHGFTHQYVNTNGGLLKINSQSEFAGLAYETQYQKISAGQKILKQKLGQNIVWWMAPSHSFDQTTCRVLHNLNFKYITDGIALYPFYIENLLWLPQQLWRPVYFPIGVWTVCIHPETVNAAYIRNLEKFIKNHRNHIISPDLAVKYSSGLLDPALNLMFTVVWKIIFMLKK
jgi:peptidoglycan/xylan/chitin deacetylase (PgdA/CDA1 family)